MSVVDNFGSWVSGNYQTATGYGTLAASGGYAVPAGGVGTTSLVKRINESFADDHSATVVPVVTATPPPDPYGNADYSLGVFVGTRSPSSATNTGYLLFAAASFDASVSGDQPLTLFALYRATAGSMTLLQNGSHTFTTNVKLESIGSSHKIYDGATQVGSTQSDATHTTGYPMIGASILINQSDENGEDSVLYVGLDSATFTGESGGGGVPVSQSAGANVEALTGLRKSTAGVLEACVGRVVAVSVPAESNKSTSLAAGCAFESAAKIAQLLAVGIESPGYVSLAKLTPAESLSRPSPTVGSALESGITFSLPVAGSIEIGKKLMPAVSSSLEQAGLIAQATSTPVECPALLRLAASSVLEVLVKAAANNSAIIECLTPARNQVLPGFEVRGGVASSTSPVIESGASQASQRLVALESTYGVSKALTSTYEAGTRVYRIGGSGIEFQGTAGSVSKAVRVALECLKGVRSGLDYIEYDIWDGETETWITVRAETSIPSGEGVCAWEALIAVNSRWDYFEYQPWDPETESYGPVTRYYTGFTDTGLAFLEALINPATGRSSAVESKYLSTRAVSSGVEQLASVVRSGSSPLEQIVQIGALIVASLEALSTVYRGSGSGIEATGQPATTSSVRVVIESLGPLSAHLTCDIESLSRAYVSGGAGVEASGALQASSSGAMESLASVARARASVLESLLSLRSALIAGIESAKAPIELQHFMDLLLSTETAIELLLAEEHVLQLTLERAN